MTSQLDTPKLDSKLKELKRLQALERTARDRQIVKARSDFQAATEFYIKDETTGNKIKLAAIHKQWIAHAAYCWENGLHCLICAPYGSGKSTQIAVGVPLFAFGQNPGLRIILASANISIARERVMLVRSYIDNDEDYHTIFPNVKADMEVGWTKTDFFLKRPNLAKDPSLAAVGITGSAIGKRADLLILDDVNDAKNTIQQPKFRKVIIENLKVLITRLEPGGKIFGIMTRWHEEDLVGTILEDETMRQQYGLLIQRVSDDFTHIVSETILPKFLPKIRTHHTQGVEHLFHLAERGMI